MTGTLRLNRIAPLVLLTLAVAAGVASVRLASLVAPAFPLIDRPSDPTAPETAVPAQLPASEVVAPANKPATGPATDSTPFAPRQAPAYAPADRSANPSSPAAGSPSTAAEPAMPATGYQVKPSRFADAEQTAVPLRLAPAQVFPKRPRPANSD